MSGRDAMRRHPAGAAIPESPEVRHHREDIEAIQLANSRRTFNEPSRPLKEIAKIMGGMTLFAVLMLLASMLGDLMGVA